MNNDDGIYWRNGNAHGRVYFEGKEYRKSLQTRDPHKARTAMAEWRKTFTPEGQLTFKQAVEAWEELNGKEDWVKASTKKRYLTSIHVLAAMFGESRLADIDTKAIGGWVRTRKQGGLVYEGAPLKPATNATIRRDLSALSSVFRACVALALYHENPVRAWDRSVIPERRAPFYVPTVAQIEVVAENAPVGLSALIRFAAYVGCRQSEAMALSWKDVRLDRGEVRFMHTKTNRPRVVALKSFGGDATPAVKALPRHLGVPWVFWHHMGERYKHLAQRWVEIMGKAQVAEMKRGRALPYFNFHKLRHAFAIRWLEQGGDIYALSAHLGHTSVKTTEIYLDYIRKGYGALDEWDVVDEAAERGLTPDALASRS